MNEVIHEVVISTVSSTGRPHLAPMGVRYESAGADVHLLPFKPSTTLDNILATGVAVLNVVLDTRVFAGCVTGRREFALVQAEQVASPRLICAASHLELRLAGQQDDPQRPRLRMARVHEAQHAPFRGFNRAQAAVLEAAVLVSRLHLLPAEKIATEMAYLQIAIDKTAGPAEREAWGWLLQAVAAYRAQANVT